MRGARTLVSALLVPVLLAARHPIHSTHTDVEVAADGAVTVVVRAFTDDLATAAQAGRGPAALPPDSALARYVRSHVQLIAGDGAEIRLTWGGARQEEGVTFSTLRGRLPGGVAGLRARQTMQMELFSDQVNVLQATVAGRRTTLLFVPGDGAKPLS
jgi:hypothetical protein